MPTDRSSSENVGLIKAEFEVENGVLREVVGAINKTNDKVDNNNAATSAAIKRVDESERRINANVEATSNALRHDIDALRNARTSDTDFERCYQSKIGRRPQFTTSVGPNRPQVE